MYNIQPGVLLLLLAAAAAAAVGAAAGAAAGAATAGRETNFKKAPREHRRRILPTLFGRSECVLEGTSAEKPADEKKGSWKKVEGAERKDDRRYDGGEEGAGRGGGRAS